MIAARPSTACRRAERRLRPPNVKNAVERGGSYRVFNRASRRSQKRILPKHKQAIKVECDSVDAEFIGILNCLELSNIKEHDHESLLPKCYLALPRAAAEARGHDATVLGYGFNRLVRHPE